MKNMNNISAEQRRQRLPEPVARMSVVKLYLAGFDRRKGTEDQNTAVPVVNGGKRMDGHTADYLQWDCFHYTTADAGLQVRAEYFIG